MRGGDICSRFSVLEKFFFDRKKSGSSPTFSQSQKSKKTPDKMYCCLVVSGNMMYNEKEEAE